jgi:hypothetical protein
MTIGPVFARHGYLCLFLLRRGVSLSTDQGPADGDLMIRAFTEGGPAGRNRVQLELLEPHRLTIYPSTGSTAREGHRLVYRSPARWEADVVGFLSRYLRP